MAGHYPERAILRESSPELVILAKTYGENFPVMWLLPQILDLVVYSNSRGTLDDNQAQFLANSIANEYHYLKVSELLLFFYRFKSGKYGHFYGVIDPMLISGALEQFIKERNAVIAEQEEREKAAERERWRQQAVSPQQACANMGMPKMRSVQEMFRWRERVIGYIDNLLNTINKFTTLC